MTVSPTRPAASADLACDCLGGQIDDLRKELEHARAQVERQEMAIVELRAKLEDSQERQNKLQDQLHSVEGENQRLGERFHLLEDQVTKISYLFAASRQLLESPDPSTMISAITEIVINSIGSEEFALYVLDDASAELRQIAAMGPQAHRWKALKPGEDPLGCLLTRGEMALTEPGETEQPAAFVPLRHEGRLAGALVVFRLLPHKMAFRPVDRELFELLGTHAARALCPARLHEKGTAAKACP